jgi:hypothetical protein
MADRPGSLGHDGDLTGRRCLDNRAQVRVGVYRQATRVSRLPSRDSPGQNEHAPALDDLDQAFIG